MWLSIIIYGSVFSLAIWVIQRSKWRLIFRIPMLAGTLIILSLAIYYDIVTGLSFLGNTSWYNTPPYVQILFFILMLLGMGVRYMTKAIEERRVKISALRKKHGDKKFEKPELEFDVWEFSYPFFFSVITFGLLLKQMDAKTLTLTISNTILSFQTGFFWQTILKKDLN
ncbi:MAG: hypothetical protein JXI43_09520 [Tissierellales bacterium]|nr:hypothetical protein [Tissierellales bacterium]